MSLITGSEYSFETNELIFVGKGNSKFLPAIILKYSTGAEVAICITSKEDLERQYNDIVKSWARSKNMI